MVSETNTAQNTPLCASPSGTAVSVSLLHSASMVASGLAAAWIVYRHVGLRAMRSSWLDLDVVWSLSLIASGGAAVAMALASDSLAGG